MNKYLNIVLLESSSLIWNFPAVSLNAILSNNYALNSAGQKEREKERWNERSTKQEVEFIVEH